jgi:hypothetical protein
MYKPEDYGRKKEKEKRGKRKEESLPCSLECQLSFPKLFFSGEREIFGHAI